MRKLLEGAPEFDFIIGSVHLLSRSAIGGEDLYALYAQECRRRPRTALGDYLEEVLALAKLGGFTVLGHLTLPLRYFNEMRGLHTSFDPYEAQIREILKTLIENGRGIELNVQPGQYAPAGRKVAEALPGAGRRAHHPGHRRPQPGACGPLHPGAAGFAERVRLYPVLHL